ncbi:MAG: hypothetical protein ACK5LJ_16350 [Paracoccus sp. (in: a-proteobacteria)]
MRLSTYKLVNLYLTHQQYGSNSSVFKDELIIAFLGADAKQAHGSYLASKEKIKEPTLDEFGLSHDQLRGVKLVEQKKREKVDNEAFIEYSNKRHQLGQTYNVLLKNLETIQYLFNSFIEGMDKLREPIIDNLEKLDTNYSLYAGDDAPN